MLSCKTFATNSLKINFLQNVWFVRDCICSTINQKGEFWDCEVMKEWKTHLGDDFLMETKDICNIESKKYNKVLFNRKKEKRLLSVVRRCNLILQMTRQKSRVNDNSSIRTLIFSGFKRNLEAPKQLGKTGAIFIISKEMSLKLFQRKCQLFKSRYIHSTYVLSPL